MARWDMAVKERHLPTMMYLRWGPSPLPHFLHHPRLWTVKISHTQAVLNSGLLAPPCKHGHKWACMYLSKCLHESTRICIYDCMPMDSKACPLTVLDFTWITFRDPAIATCTLLHFIIVHLRVIFWSVFPYYIFKHYAVNIFSHPDDYSTQVIIETLMASDWLVSKSDVNGLFRFYQYYHVFSVVFTREI